MVVSFDRRGYSDVITHQAFYRTASDDFAAALSAELNGLGMDYKPCDGGMYTDSKEFAEIVPECTNISVGYFSEHTKSESLDLPHLLRLRDALICIDWTKLPIRRVPEPDTPWQGYSGKVYGSADSADVPKFLIRSEALESCRQLRAAAQAGDLCAGELDHHLLIIEGFLKL
jgi:hypothetical protein